MAGEREILQTFLTGAARSPLAGVGARVQASWLGAGLPIEPSEGLEGRAQLRTVVRELRRLAVEASSLVELDPWERGPVQFVAADDRADDPESIRFEVETFEDLDRQEVIRWIQQIDTVIVTLGEYLGNDGFPR